MIINHEAEDSCLCKETPVCIVSCYKNGVYPKYTFWYMDNLEGVHIAEYDVAIFKIYPKQTA